MKANRIPGTVSLRCYEIRGASRQQIDIEVIEETQVTLYVNGQPWVSLMMTPCDLEAFALGFLRNEGYIETLDEVEIVEGSPSRSCVDVWLNRDLDPPQRHVLTSGCGGGVTFDMQELEPLSPGEGFSCPPDPIWKGFVQLQPAESLYARARGVHAAGILDLSSGKLLATCEDVGRHNTLDKLSGICLRGEITTATKALITTGRMSSEMVRKARRMKTRLVASRTAATSQAVELAEHWGITLIGYVRANSMRIYTHPERLTDC